MPTDGESHFNRGNALDQLGRHDEAAASFGAVLKITPGDEAAAYNLGNSLKALGKTDEALGVYRYALKRQQSGGGGGGGANPREPATHANIGYTLDAAGRYGEAIGAFQASLALLPTDASVHTGLGHALKSKGDMSAAADAYRKALSIEPTASAAYAGLGQALRTIDPKGAAAALALGGDSLNAEADKVRAWLGRQPAAADGGGSARDSLYPEVFESAPRCKQSTMADAVAMGATALAAGPPMKLAGGTAGWLANGWNDTALAAEVGESAMRMLVMPQARDSPSLAPHPPHSRPHISHPVLLLATQAEHPELDTTHDAMVEPAMSGVYFRDYLALLDRTATTREFAVYIAQFNLLNLPALMAQVCLPEALPSASLSLANFWVGGALMRNGLHFDNYDNLLFQIKGSKRALIFPPTDTEKLYYTAANIRRHNFSW